MFQLKFFSKILAVSSADNSVPIYRFGSGKLDKSGPYLIPILTKSP